MAPPMYLRFFKVLVLYLALFSLISMFLYDFIESDHELQTNGFGPRRRLLGLEEDNQELLTKKNPSSLSTVNNQTKLIKSSNKSTKNQTKLIKSNLSTKNQTKLSKSTNSTKEKKPTFSSTISKSELNQPAQTLLKKKKLNSTLLLKKLNSTLKASNSSKTTSLLSKTTSDLPKLSSSKNKTSTIKKPTQQESSRRDPNKEKIQLKEQKKESSWIEQEDDSDLMGEFRDFPTKFQQILVPDLEKISTTSKAYITKYNKQFTKQFKPYVGNKRAPTIATVISCAFILIPLLLVSLVFNRIKAYFSLQKLLIFIQVYLSIYFSILCLTSLVTGLEPLRFFYASLPSTYVGLQVLQTLGYMLYLLLLLTQLVLVLSTESGLCSRTLALGQTLLGFTIGLHYCVAVFHRMVLHQPPKISWKAHGMYATCFLVICLCARADRRKKVYFEEEGEEGKKN